MEILIPEFFLVGLALVLLMLDTFVPALPKRMFALVGATGAIGSLFFYGADLHANLYAVVALVATALTLLLSFDYAPVIKDSSNDGKGESGTGEFYILPMIACAGITALCKATDFITLFVGLEVLTLASYVMVGYFRRNLGSMEAGVKYLILGAVSTGVLVFGLAWYFGATGTFEISRGAVLTAAHSGFAVTALFAFALMLTATAFKIGAAPMQMWIPDVYQGAPTPTTAFLSVASKTAGFAVLAKILTIFTPFAVVPLIMMWITAITLMIGNLAAIPQTNMKRLLGYSSIAQAGFILPFFIFSPNGQVGADAPVYLAMYLVMTFGAFFALALVRMQRGSEEIEAFRGLGVTNPRLAFSITVIFASLAGVPLTAGFVAKLWAFIVVVDSPTAVWSVLPFMIVGAAAGFYYYFKVIRSMYWLKPADTDVPIRVPLVSGIILIAITLFILGAGIVPFLFR